MKNKNLKIKKFLAVLFLQFFFTAFFLYSQKSSDFSYSSPSRTKKTSKAVSALLAESDSPIKVCAWNPNGSSFLTSWENTLLVWDSETNKPFIVCQNIQNPVVSLKFSRDGKYFMVITEDNTIILCYSGNYQEIARIKGESGEQILTSAFSNDNLNLLIPLNGNDIFSCFRLVMTKKFLSKQIKAHKKTIYSLDVNSKNNRILSASRDGTVKLWNPETGECLYSFKAYTNSNFPAVFNPDGDSFIFAENNSSITVKNIYGDTLLQIKESDGPCTKAVFSPDGRNFAVALKNGIIRVYDAETGAFLKNLECSSEDNSKVGQICDFAYSSDGNYIVGSTANGYLYRWTLNGKVYTQSKTEKENLEAKITEIISAIEESALPQKSEDYFEVEETESAQINQLEDSAEEIQENAPAKVKKNKSKKNKKTKTEDISTSIPAASVNKPSSQIFIGAGYTTIPSNYYLGEFDLDLGFEKSFKRLPLFVGLEVKAGTAMPLKDFPYDYYTSDGKQLNSPWIYTANPGLTLGCELFSQKGVRVFFDLYGGASIRVLWNNHVNYSVNSPIYYGGFGGFSAGLDLKPVTLKVSCIYDTTFGLQNFCGLEFSKRFYPRRRRLK